MEARKIRPIKHFDSTCLGSFTKGVERDVPPTWAKHFVDAGVAEYADEVTGDGTGEKLPPVDNKEKVASGAESTADAPGAGGSTEVTGGADDGASGPQDAPVDQDPKPAAKPKKQGGRKPKEQ